MPFYDKSNNELTGTEVAIMLFVVCVNFGIGFFTMGLLSAPLWAMVLAGYIVLCNPILEYKMETKK